MRRFSRLVRHVAMAFLGCAAISVSNPAMAQAGCTPIATMLICQGDHSNGIELTDPAFTLLWVDSLTTEISPTNIAGIRFYSTGGGQMAVMSATGPFGISTSGDDAPGIWVDSYAQRINSVARFQSGDVAVFSHDRITTTGDESYGIVADSVTGIVHSTEDVESRGGDIVVYSYGSVLTRGSNANGVDVFNSISARSTMLDGSAEAWGGDIRVNARDVETMGHAALGIGVRHNLSSNANGDAVSWGGSIAINNAGIVSTRGQGSSGILASSSIFSTGDSALAIGPEITVTSRSVETGEDGAAGIVASAMAIATSNGTGRADALIQDMWITSEDVVTHGDGSTGIVVSAVANATGDSSVDATRYGVVVTSNGLISTQGASSRGIWIDTTVDAISEDASPATGRIDTTRVDNNGTIVTRGADASGIVVQQKAIAESRLPGGWADASTGPIVINSSDIRTSGISAFGIFVDSYVVAASDDFSVASTGSITINSHNLRTTGTGASGILVRSEMERHGVAGSATSGDVVVNSTGVLAATGEDAYGISVDNRIPLGGTEAGDISINVLGGSVTGGSGLGAGIMIANGGNNAITNYGTISALSGTAIIASWGSTTIDNFGRVIGNVSAFGGTQAFNNHASGIFDTLDYVLLGAGNTLTNAGVLSPGGAGAIQETMVLGDLEQTASGRYLVDLDFATGDSDRIEVFGGGGAAVLGGTIVANALVAAGSAQQFFILSSADGVVDNGLTAVDTAVVDYSVIFDPNGQDVHLGAVVDFAPTGLNANQSSVARSIGALQAAGPSAAFAPALGALMNLASIEELAAAYDRLSPEVYGSLAAESAVAAEQFSNELMSCRVAGGPHAAIREGECLWARARATDRDVDTTASNVGSKSRIGSFSAGVQVAMAADWRLGVGVGYDLVSLSTSSGATVDGERANVGAVVKYNPGPFVFAAGVAAGWGDYDTDRAIGFGAFAATASSSSNTDYVSGWLHAAYLAERGGWYLKPLVDLRITEIDFSGARETGGAALTVAGARDTVFSVSPAVEVGTEFRFDALAIWRPFLRAGLTWRDTDEISTVASFAGVPAGVPSFAVATGMDDVLLDVAAGFDVIDADGVAMRVQYDGRFGSESSQNSFSLKGSVPF